MPVSLSLGCNVDRCLVFLADPLFVQYRCSRRVLRCSFSPCPFLTLHLTRAETCLQSVMYCEHSMLVCYAPTTTVILRAVTRDMLTECNVLVECLHPACSDAAHLPHLRQAVQTSHSPSLKPAHVPSLHRSCAENKPCQPPKHSSETPQQPAQPAKTSTACPTMQSHS